MTLLMYPSEKRPEPQARTGHKRCHLLLGTSASGSPFCSTWAAATSSFFLPNMVGGKGAA